MDRHRTAPDRRFCCLPRCYAAVLLILVLAMARPVSALAAETGTTCGPGPAGTTCGGAAPASLGNISGTDLGAGNPINVITGNKYQREVDLPALPGELGLEIVRHYNSALGGIRGVNGILGRGWKLSYETELYAIGSSIQIVQADGTRLIFQRDARQPHLCASANPAHGSVTIARAAQGETYTWRWTDGRRLTFNADGKLVQILAPSGAFVTMQHDSRGLLVKVTDPQWRSLHLTYPDKAAVQSNQRFRGVQAIDSPVGRFSYAYGSAMPKGTQVEPRLLLANLTEVHFPAAGEAGAGRPATAGGATRRYHYENAQFPTLLTGISIGGFIDGKQQLQRYATFGYDDNGRANLSTHAGDVGKVTLDTRQGGKTVLTNSLGQKTVYLHATIAGEHRLLEVRGAGCARCGEVNLRYRYDALARLIETTRLSLSGEPVATTRREYDQLGRTIRTGKVAYVQGKPQTVQWMTRFEYVGNSFAPSIIARPSVVLGKEALTHIEYNDAGQPIKVRESGWAPSADGSQAAARIERMTNYRYARINDRSLLVEIDGPLPNGKTNSPLDSDITILQYDNRNDTAPPPPSDTGKLQQYERRDGLLTRIIAPDNINTEIIERDSALRPTKLRAVDGAMTQLTTIEHSWRGMPVSIELLAGSLHRRMSYEYDALDQVAAVTLPGKLRMTFQHDSAGRIGKAIMPDGSGVLFKHDSENRIERSARFLEQNEGIASALPDIHFNYDRPIDRPGRLTHIDDAMGLIKRYRYNDLGQVAAITSALNISTQFHYDTSSLLAKVTSAVGSLEAATVSMVYDSNHHTTGITAPNEVRTVRRYDDFGRKVLEADPDHGITLYHYDAADRMVASIDETMVTTRFTYDYADRLLAIGADKQPHMVQYYYRGRQLSEVISSSDGNPEHAAERIKYVRDALGLVTKETRWLASVAPPVAGTMPNGASGVTFITINDYDEAGRLVGQTLPDGHRLTYRYAPALATGARTMARHKPGQLEAILFDDQVIVNDIEQTIAGGMTGYTMGNGVRHQIRLDRRNRVEQLQVMAHDPSASASWWKRIKSWFSSSHTSNTASLYTQVNRYDEEGKIIGIERHQPRGQGHAAPPRREGYEYDQLKRLTAMIPDNAARIVFRYDKAGNRLSESSLPTSTQTINTAALAKNPGETLYRYADGSNRLIAITESKPATGAVPNAADMVRWLHSAWLYHRTGVQLAQLQWLKNGSTGHRRTIFNSAKRPIKVYENEQLIASYHYNTLGERIAKTLYPPHSPMTPVAAGTRRQAQGETSYNLYRDQRLAAESDGAGNITAHYIYLYGKPVAKIEMRANDSRLHALWKTITMRTEATAGDRLASIYTIVTDHLGTPQQVIDAHSTMVWQADTNAFGQAHVTYAASESDGKPFVMNLRLPGQVFDAETGLHYNYLRDYDPATGRYTAPDPVGLGGGLNPYAYASNNPLTNIDPLGLYQIDVHYYMTFFLAITAGVDKDTARRMALATQYVDDNPVTEPMLPGSSLEDLFDSVLINRIALLRYHFVQDGYDPARTTTENVYRLIFNFDMQSYIERRVANPNNPQLNLLLAASERAKSDANATCDSSVQLFGEYLHAFEDTFSHRNAKNEPYSPTFLSQGFGHGWDNKNPDFTYNHFTPCCLGAGWWNNNEARTLQMEKEVFQKMTAFSRPNNNQNSFLQIQFTLEKFNSFQADDSDLLKLAQKIEILNQGLKTLGYKDIDMTFDSKKEGYDEEIAKKNRADALNRLKPSDYFGTILPQGTAPLPK